MSRAIDADALKERFKSADANGINLALDRYALKCIDEAPTIDAIRVIRCRNCLSYAKRNDGEGKCRWHKSIVKDDDFCSYGIGGKE